MMPSAGGPGGNVTSAIERSTVDVSCACLWRMSSVRQPYHERQPMAIASSAYSSARTPLRTDMGLEIPGARFHRQALAVGRRHVDANAMEAGVIRSVRRLEADRVHVADVARDLLKVLVNFRRVLRRERFAAARVRELAQLARVGVVVVWI